MPVTSENVNKGAAVTVDPNDPYPDIIARPLAQPDFVNVKPKNKEVSFRWVNRVAGGGMRLDQMTFAGFVPATVLDCISVQASMVKDGKILNGDLILMKISRQIYEGALKNNWNRSINRLHPKAQLQNGRAQLGKTIAEAGGSRIPNLQSKLSAFRPNDAEVAAAERAEDAGGGLDLGIRPDVKE